MYSEIKNNKLNFINIFKYGFFIYKKNIKFISIFSLILTILIVFYSKYPIYISNIYNYNDISSYIEENKKEVLKILLNISIFIINFIFNIIIRLIAKKDIENDNEYKFTIKQISKIFLKCIITYFIIAVLILGIILIFELFGYLLGYIELNNIFFIILYSIFFILLINFFIRIYFSINISISTNIYGLKSIFYSNSLSKNYRKRIFLWSFLFLILFSLPGIILKILLLFYKSYILLFFITYISIIISSYLFLCDCIFYLNHYYLYENN